MSITYLEREQIPAHFLRGFNYNGRKFKVQASGKVTIHDTIWGGGTRSTWHMLRLADGALAPLDQSKRDPKPGDPFGWIPNVDGQSFDIPEGYAVVEHSIFCGKDMGLTFYVRPEALAPLLPPPAEIDQRDRRILGTFAGLKSGEYRREALAKLSYTGADRDRLVALGMLRVSSNGATAVTTAGRNASQGMCP